GIANALHAAGICKGDRVLLLLDSSAEYVAALHAVWRLGAVAVPLGPQTKAAKLAHVLVDTGARALLTQASLATAWTAALAGQAPLQVWAHGETSAQPWPQPASEATPTAGPASASDLAALIYTSGTTCVPK